uniref:Uncharacterized protein n=1 Tax=Physcomitrium patens TaxID=3218 RepID=A0A2K1JCP0_PHYPA|nr:hypothetical protein PHYPA_019578 [Physcomitrium patens]
MRSTFHSSSGWVQTIIIQWPLKSFPCLVSSTELRASANNHDALPLESRSSSAVQRTAWCGMAWCEVRPRRHCKLGALRFLTSKLLESSHTMMWHHWAIIDVRSFEHGSALAGLGYDRSWWRMIRIADNA